MSTCCAPEKTETQPATGTKRFHVHMRVDDLAANIRFYSALFGAEPARVQDDYAKWMLDDPRVNFAISTRGEGTGIDHLGLQVESDAALTALRDQAAAADIAAVAQEGTACCYARSDKYWLEDPQGTPWETFNSLDTIPTFNEADDDVAAGSACCVPAAPPAANDSGCAPKAGGTDQSAKSGCC